MQGQFIAVNGFRTHYFDRGKGPVVVLMHGASIAIDAWLTWHSTIARLSGNFRVVAYDQPGFGRTDMPKDGRYLNRLLRTDHALAFIDRLGVERAILVGHSEGGFIAARMAITRPALAEKLVIVTSGGTAPRLGGALDREWMAASKAAYDCSGGADTEEGFIRGNAILRRGHDPAIELMLRDNYRRAVTSGQIEMFRRRTAGETDIERYTLLQEEHIHPYLPQLALPVLIVWAADDPTVPVERGLRLARLCASADFHVFGGASHMVMFDRQEAFNGLLTAWCAGKQ